jgi:hypothetical protein
MSYKFKIEEKISETLEDFKALLPRYLVLKNDRRMLHLFFSRNRNPLWDLSGNKIFKTGLKSSKLILEGGDAVEDHFIQRTKAMRIIFSEMEKNPNMTVDEFTIMIMGINSTVSLTKEEHNMVTSYCKEYNILNYQAYNILGIQVEGLVEFLENKNILI